MKIYRFVPDIRPYAHAWSSYGGIWWPPGIDLGRALELYYDMSDLGIAASNGHYRRSPEELDTSDFPILSLQVPVMSERAADRLGAHPEHSSAWPELASRLRPMWIGEQRYFAVQPLFSVRGEPNAFIPEASEAIRLPGGEVVHYHTRAFEPSRLRGEFFTIPQHEPYAETYVTEVFVERAHNAGLTGIDHLELVFDDGPIRPHYTSPRPELLDNPMFRYELEWELFFHRGDIHSYVEADLRPEFRKAVLDGLLPISDRATATQAG